MNSFTLRMCDADAEALTATLEQQGVCVVPDWLDRRTIEALREELTKSLPAPRDNDDGAFNPGRLVALKRSEIADRLPETFRQFSNPVFENVARNYVGGRFSFNDDIFVSDHTEDRREILPLHYDRLWCLKFYFYLKDTTRNDGAFEAIPGSHHAGHRRRTYLLSRGMRAEDLPNRTDPLGFDGVLPLEGGGGTLIVFDSDVLHKGGVVGEGGRRLVMRGHTHRVPKNVYRPNRWSAQWRREARLNPITALRRFGDKLLGADQRLKL